MSDLAERRGGLGRLRMALAELEPSELAEALADVDALALARASHARVPIESLDCRYSLSPCAGEREVRFCPGGRQRVEVGCCDRHAAYGSVPL